MSRRWSIRHLLVVTVALIALLGACSDEARDSIQDATGDVTTPEGGEGTAPPATEPPATEPPATEPPATAPPEQPAPEQPAQEDGLSTEEWVLIILLGVIVLVIVLAATGAASRRQQSKEAQLADTRRRLGDIVGGARWVNDQGSLDILRISDPDQLRVVWTGTRQRLIDVEGRASMFATSTDDANLAQQVSYLGQVVAALRGAIDANVSVRLDPAAPGRDEPVAQTTQTVYQRRQQLDATIAPLAMPR